MAQYYPKSQITPNLYTRGGELMILSNGQEYVGDYYRVSTGETFAGKTSSTSNQKKLVPLNNPESFFQSKDKITFVENWEIGPNERFLNLSPNRMEINKDYNKLLYKNTLLPPPTDVIKSSLTVNSYTFEDIQSGEYTRYFAKRFNQFIYFEINKETYKQYQSKDPKVDVNLYECIQMPWKFSDNDVNIKITALMEKRNKWFGFTKWVEQTYLPPITNNTSSTDTPEPTPGSIGRIGY